MATQSLKKWAVVVAAVLCLWAALGGRATANILLTNGSSKPVTVSSSATEPREGQVVAPNSDLSLSAGSYYLTNQKTAQAALIVDTRRYVIKDSLTTVGLVQAYIVAAGMGTVSAVSDAVPVTGEF